MLPSVGSVDLARLQFAVDVSYHFLFVPLTLGLAWILFAMELAYVWTGKQIYKDMTRYWGKLFGINFALGVLTGLTMEFQFGTNWAYYSQYVGDIFGTPLAIEGLVAFMLESTFFGIFFFGWDKLSKRQHLMATFFLAIGSSLSALLILVANGFMQHPVGAYFDFHTMRMQTENLWQLFLNPLAQIGFAHTVIAGYTTGAMFVMGISAYFLLRKRDIEFAKRSFAIAAGFGLVATVMVAFLGDANGVAVATYQPEKLAAIEAEWTTQKPPAAFNAIAWPNQAEMKNDFAIQIPDVLGLIVTHSWNHKIEGLKDIAADNEKRIESGMQAYSALTKMRAGSTSAAVMDQFNAHKKDLGYGLLLERYTKHPAQATPQQIDQAAHSTIPSVWWLFWTFRIMVLLGCLMILTCVVGVVYVLRNKLEKPRWFLHWCLYTLPFPWLACLSGWFVAEHGRQPWTIYGDLPTTISSSSIGAGDVALSLGMFVLLYTVLLIVELYLMVKFARLGPSSLHTGRYFFEQQKGAK